MSDLSALSGAMPDLARQALAVYRDEDRERYLDNLFRLQIVAGRYGDALGTIAALRGALAHSHPPRGAWVNAQYEIYARARADEAEALPFGDAYSRSFRDAFARLDDRTSALVIRALTLIDPAGLRSDLQRALDGQKSKRTIPLQEALRLVHDYQVAEAYRAAAPLDPALIDEDDRRRYVAEKDVLVKMPDHASVCALVMRPRRASKPLTTLLNFTIYVDPGDNMSNARQTAANGYAAVVGFTRGKACSPDRLPVPYEHDGADAAALVDWIAAQPWSDGRVGMYGGSYEGFTQFAAAKHRPKALRALMAGAPAAPGVDVPMEGNVFWNFVYPWPFYTTNAKGADDATYGDSARWRKLDRDWYASGRAYRDLDRIDGTPNPVFDLWIAHPSYDGYWQSLIPYRQEFAQIDIPTLVTAGYYYGGPGAAVHYFSQLREHAPGGGHYLVIGPYHHIGAQYGVVGLLGNVYDTLAGLELDAVAKVDLTELRYEWFDHVFKGAPRPSLLEDHVNYQVTGANVWKHASSLAAMVRHSLSLLLGATRSGESYRLSDGPPSGASVDLTVDLADRTDVDRDAPGGGVVDDAVDTRNGVEWVGEPLAEATELSGLFSGHLDFVCNKKDFDFEIDLYERTARGKYVQLAPYWARASYVADGSRRQLLTPGRRHQLDFRSIRLMSRQLQPGSRLVVVLRVVKERGRQINYGTGKDVSDETIADAKEPLQIRWFDDSSVSFPVGS